MSTAIPPDIVDEIIAHIPLDPHLRKTLQSLSLISRQFVGPSQRRLFNELDFGLLLYSEYSAPPSVAPPSFIRLGDILRESPHLVGYVKTLWFPGFLHAGFFGTEWIIHHPSIFSDIVDSLTSASSSSAHKVTLNGSYNYPPSDWNQLPLESEKTFYRIFSMPNIRALTIAYMAIPDTFFRGFGALEDLEIVNLSWMTTALSNHDRSESDIAARRDFRESLRQVQKLTRFVCEADRDERLSYDTRMDLNTLTIERGLDLTSVTHGAWWMELSRTALASLRPLNPATLVELRLGLFDVLDDIGTRPLNLSSCHNLSKLIISHQGSFNWCTLSTKWIAETLSSFPHNHQLHSLNLSFHNPESKPIDLYSTLQDLVQPLRSLHSRGKRLEEIEVNIHLFFPVAGQIETEEKVRQVREYVVTRVRWEGCESVLRLAVVPSADRRPTFLA